MRVKKIFFIYLFFKSKICTINKLKIAALGNSGAYLMLQKINEASFRRLPKKKKKKKKTTKRRRREDVKETMRNRIEFCD